MRVMKTLITPGRLYAQLSREFRAVCCARCAACILPPPHPIQDSGDGPTWAIGEVPSACEPCAAELERLVSRLQERFDLLDPISPRVPLPAHSAFRFPLPAARLN